MSLEVSPPWGIALDDVVATPTLTFTRGWIQTVDRCRCSSSTDPEVEGGGGIHRQHRLHRECRFWDDASPASYLTTRRRAPPSAAAQRRTRV
jgi:hypothetical protein